MQRARLLLALGLCLCWSGSCLVADWRSSVAWGLKLWGASVNSPGLIETGGTLAVLAMALAAPRAWWEWIWQAGAWAVGGMAVWGMEIWVREQHATGQAAGPFTNADQFGIACVVGAFVAARARNWPMAGLALAGAVLAECRGAALGLVVGLVIWLGARWGMVLGVLAGGVVVWRHSDLDSLGPRVDLLHRAIWGITQRPLGWGHAGWLWLEVRATPLGMVWDMNDRAHSLVVDWMLVGGLVGASAMTGLVGWALVRLWVRDRLAAATLGAYLVSMSTLYETWVSGVVLMLLVGYSMQESRA